MITARARIASVIATTAVTVLSGTQAHANDCDVNPFQAYQTAVKRGWSFGCLGSLLPGAEAAIFLPEAPNRIGCLWTTGPIPTPIPPTVEMTLFDRLPSGGSSGQLLNGWRVKNWELTGGQFSKLTPAVGRVRASVVLGRHNRSFHYRLTKLVLTKSGGSCAKAIDEAF
jgi:hypothetical protein